MKVLVCGGRQFNEPDFMFNELDYYHGEFGFSAVIEGDAEGADRWAGLWALAHGIDLRKFPANWKKHGRAAGPIRNKQMLEEGRPGLVIAFPGGKGTANMVKQARAAGIQVIEVSATTDKEDTR